MADGNAKALCAISRIRPILIDRLESLFLTLYIYRDPLAKSLSGTRGAAFHARRLTSSSFTFTSKLPINLSIGDDTRSFPIRFWTNLS